LVIRNISEAKAQLSALIAMVERGDEVILAKSGKPVAKIVPYAGVAQRRRPGSMEGEIWIAPDFDELPDDMAEALGMRQSRRGIGLPFAFSGRTASCRGRNRQLTGLPGMSEYRN
jgi:prevent-host-death family protein